MKKKMSGIIILASIAFCCFGEGKTIKSMTFATPEKSKLATWTTNNAKIAMKHDAGIGRTKPGSLLIDLGTETPLKTTALYVVNCPVVHGKKYLLTVFVKGENLSSNGKIRLSLLPKDADQKYIWSLKNLPTKKLKGTELKEEWNKLQLEFGIPAGNNDWKNVASLDFSFGVSNISAGKVWFDDITVMEE